MGLYLTIFAGDEELDGVEVGSYADFHTFRTAVVEYFEAGMAGSKCPTLVLHPDCDGEWSPNEAKKLQQELGLISERFRQLPAAPLEGPWKLGLGPINRIPKAFEM